MELLLEQEQIDVNVVDKNENNSIHVACAQGDVDILNMLIVKDFNINAQNCDGNTALHIACREVKTN